MCIYRTAGAVNGTLALKGNLAWIKRVFHKVEILNISRLTMPRQAG